MGDYYYGVVPEYKLLVPIGGKNFDGYKYEELKKYLADYEDEGLDAGLELLTQILSDPVHDLSDYSVDQLKVLDHVYKFVWPRSENIISSAVIELFGEMIADIVHSSAMIELEKQGYTVLDWSG